MIEAGTHVRLITYQHYYVEEVQDDVAILTYLTPAGTLVRFNHQIEDLVPHKVRTLQEEVAERLSHARLEKERLRGRQRREAFRAAPKAATDVINVGYAIPKRTVWRDFMFDEFKSGDIVLAGTGYKYVVVEFYGAANGKEMVVLKRIPDLSGGETQTSKEAGALTLVETPVFAQGETVKVMGVEGTVIDETDDHHVNVQMPAFAHPLKSDPDVKLEIDPSITRCPKWQLVLENRL